MFSIADKLENVRSRIQKSSIAEGRADDGVLLLPVSKKHSAEAVLEAYKAGVRSLGENYVSEAVEKQAVLQQLCAEAAAHLTWHFIGPVQSNKTKLIAEHFDWVQSVDRLKIAKRLNEHRDAKRGALNVCIQVNIDGEESKSGLLLDEVLSLAGDIAQLPNLRLRGLMTIPSADASDENLALSMGRMRQAFETLQHRYQSVDTLSMGMSSDLEMAIAHGSTMVRIGTAIFGSRDT